MDHVFVIHTVHIAGYNIYVVTKVNEILIIMDNFHYLVMSIKEILMIMDYYHNLVIKYE